MRPLAATDRIDVLQLLGNRIGSTVPLGSTGGRIFTQNTSKAGLRITPMGLNYVYNEQCGLLKGPTITVASTGAYADLSNAVGGHTYWIAIKLGNKGVVGKTTPTFPVYWSFVSGFGIKDYVIQLLRK